MINDAKKLKVLLWKSYRLRRYHWILTLIELILPIFIAFIVTKITYSLSINDSSIIKPYYPPETSREEFLKTFNPQRLAYAPSNKFTDSLMNRVIKIFGKFKITKLKDEKEMENYINSYKENNCSYHQFVAIIFHECLSDEMPEHLNYIIRDTKKWDTNILYSNLLVPALVHDDPYRDSGFAAIQMAINDEFMFMKTKEAPWKHKKILFQPFPYPEYVSDRSTNTRIANFSVFIKSLRAFVSETIFSVIVLTVMITSIPLIKDIIEEKESGVKKLMKIAGISESMVWSNWFIHRFIITAISYTMVTVILKCPVHGEGSEGIRFVLFPILLITLLMYSVANISYCFMFCAIFKRANVASAIYLITTFVLLISFHYLDSTDISTSQTFVWLLPIGAFRVGFSRIQYFEIHGMEFRWSSFLAAENNEHSISLFFALIILLFDTFLYLGLTFYIINTNNPGNFGGRESLFFVFEILFSSFKNNQMQPTTNFDDELDDKFIEPPLPGMEATIRMKNLTKNFGSFNAVDRVNLNIYCGEITALLGHNGAGKSTIMSILAGLTSLDLGSIYYKDIDVLENITLFRKNIGMCPQEDRLFPYLSVMDHLLFFGMLKGASLKEATEEANEYLTLMELESKKNSSAEMLSGGMKRKLCLSISLMGKPDMLILDEPTSGMDVQSRRKIWGLLSKMRENRTILLTTHYMEEADALGDRIAIMHQGSIVCHGTPIFLKKTYGTGYELTVTKEIEDTNRLTQIVQSTLANSAKVNETANEVVYKLPLTETSNFAQLFRNLEANKSELGIKSMGMACTTMEHVFLKASGLSIHDSRKSTKSTKVAEPDCNLLYLNNITGLALVFRQIWALFWKKCLYTRKNLLGLFTRIVLPTIIVAFLLHDLKHLQGQDEQGLDLSLHTYPRSVVFIQKNETDYSDFTNIYFRDYTSKQDGSLIQSENPNIVEGLLTNARKNILQYNKNFIMAIEFNSTSYKLLYNLKQRHSLPILINTYSNVIPKIISSVRLSIATRNHPIEQETQVEGPSSHFYVVWFIALAFYTVDTMAYFNEFITKERLSGFKHMQMMSNVPPVVYWLGMFTFDFLLFFLIIVLRVATFKIFDFCDFLTFPTTLGVIALLSFLSIISGLLFVYVTNFFSSSKNGSYMLLFLLNTVGCFVIAVFYLFEMIQDHTDEIQFDHWVLLFHITKYAILFTPPLNFSLLFIKMMKIWEENSRCKYVTPSTLKICKSTYPEIPYLADSLKNSNSLLLGIKFLFFDIVLYAVILALISGGYVGYWFNKWKIFVYGDHCTKEDLGDSDVQEEYERVQSFKSNPLINKQAALLVDGLRKNYIIWNKPIRIPKFFTPFTLVADVNFIVKPGECFGLLGANGAGKTTIFKILTTDISPTKGDAAMDGVRLSTNKKRYMSMAGYCAQTNCFIEELTGREMLTLIASLRGVKEKKISGVVDKWISILGLEEYQNQNCGSYSGGSKRKLCTAMSLIGDPKVVFLDEPTSGVDPVSRRQLYDVMAQSKKAGQTLVLTSHSMEECETLCDRLTIMTAGAMKCIGTPQHLKKRYAQGFLLLVKIHDVDEFKEELENLKSNIINMFSLENTILKDEHRGLLYYQIKDISLVWSILFERMEDIKNRHHEVIDDYVLTNISLEEVFLSFTKLGAQN